MLEEQKKKKEINEQAITRLLIQKKVTAKNAFDVPILGARPGQDWHRLSNGLFNDHTIYGYRVDALHNSTFHMFDQMYREYFHAPTLQQPQVQHHQVSFSQDLLMEEENHCCPPIVKRNLAYHHLFSQQYHSLQDLSLNQQSVLDIIYFQTFSNTKIPYHILNDIYLTFTQNQQKNNINSYQSSTENDSFEKAQFTQQNFNQKYVQTIFALNYIEKFQKNKITQITDKKIIKKQQNIYFSDQIEEKFNILKNSHKSITSHKIKNFRSQTNNLLPLSNYRCKWLQAYEQQKRMKNKCCVQKYERQTFATNFSNQESFNQLHNENRSSQQSSFKLAYIKEEILKIINKNVLKFNIILQHIPFLLNQIPFQNKAAICFLAILHLANQQNYELVETQENNFTIVKQKSKSNINML